MASRYLPVAKDSIAAKEPTEPMFRYFVMNDCFVEACLATDRFGALISNSGCWSSPGVSLIEFATTLLSLNYWKQCPLSGGQFGSPYFRLRMKGTSPSQVSRDLWGLRFTAT